MKSAISGVIGVVVACSVSVAAQWPKVTDTSVPRDAQGKVQMDAPAPRTADGKPDLSGIWMRANSGPPGRGRGRGQGGGQGQAGRGGGAGGGDQAAAAPNAGGQNAEGQTVLRAYFFKGENGKWSIFDESGNVMHET